MLKVRDKSTAEEVSISGICKPMTTKHCGKRTVFNLIYNIVGAPAPR
jgi:hypothetical protein